VLYLCKNALNLSKELHINSLEPDLPPLLLFQKLAFLYFVNLFLHVRKTVIAECLVRSRDIVFESTLDNRYGYFSLFFKLNLIDDHLIN
jgi:hypothetical protein